jgi:hypothetical protein
MNKTDYRKALHSARAEFEKLLQERAGLDSRIVRLKQTIAGLTSLCNGNDDTRRALSKIAPLPPRFMRLTSAIRQLLAGSTSPMRPPDVRTSLADLGFNLSQYANKLAVIHNTLSRLEKQGEAMLVSGGWVLTDKGKLASQMDSLDFPPPVDIGSSPDAKLLQKNRNRL